MTKDKSITDAPIPHILPSLQDALEEFILGDATKLVYKIDWNLVFRDILRKSVEHKR